MKQLLTILFFVLLGTVCRGQRGSGTVKPLPQINMAYANEWTVYSPPWVKGDTIDLTMTPEIHFIKIGESLYQIVPHPTTIEKVEKSYLFGVDSTIIWKPGIFSIPSPHPPKGATFAN